MAPLLGRYNATIRLIESARLTPTEHSIWRAFLDEAVDPEYAAQYIWERIHHRSGRPPEQVLQELKLDWKRVVTKLAKRDQVSSEARTLVEARDDSHCFMLDQKPSDPSVTVRFDHAWVIPPSLFDDSEMDPQGPLYPLLQAFLTPAKTSELQTLLQNDTLESRLRNLFLLSPSVHSTFRNGHVQISPLTDTEDQWNDETETRIKTASKVYYFVSRLWPEPCDRLFLSDGNPWDRTIQMFIMETQDANLPLPHPFLFRTHYRIAASLHLFHVEDRVAEGWPSPPLLHLNTMTQKILRSLWHLVPRLIRVQCYRVLLKLGNHLYPRSFTGLVHRLPFGLYAKECNRSAFLVHRYVRKETKDKISAVHSRPYRSVFTHADLHPSNIIMDRGRLSGIVDWECAGFYPEYREFTKLMYGAERFPEIQRIIRDTFTEDYEGELEAETLLWNDTPFGI